MAFPLISIIVPVYNTEQYLTECLDSITCQTYKKLEIVVVDDASTDGSSRIIAEFQQKDNRIKYFKHEKNGGICKARNTGLKHATGKFIAWCDSDDVLHPQFIEYLHQVLTREDTDFVECQSISDYKFNKDILPPPIWFGEPVITGNTTDFLRRFATHRLQTSLWSKLFKRELFDGFSFPAGRIYEENYYYATMYNRINKAAYSTLPLYFYRKRVNSIMNTFSPKELKEGLKIINLFITFPTDESEEIKTLFRQKALKSLILYWQRTAMIDTTLALKIRYNKLVMRFMNKTSATLNDIVLLSRKQQLIYKHRNNTLMFLSYIVFLKYIKGTNR